MEAQDARVPGITPLNPIPRIRGVAIPTRGKVYMRMKYGLSCRFFVVSADIKPCNPVSAVSETPKESTLVHPGRLRQKVKEAVGRH